jgi:hypothetical protein
VSTALLYYYLANGLSQLGNGDFPFHSEDQINSIDSASLPSEFQQDAETNEESVVYRENLSQCVGWHYLSYQLACIGDVSSRHEPGRQPLWRCWDTL